MSSLKNQAIQNALTGDWQSAISLNKTLLLDNPADIDALNRLALALMALGKIREAKTNYLKVLEIDPLNPIALKNLKRLKEKAFTQKSYNGQPWKTNNKFIEETGKTKIVELVNVAQPKVVGLLRAGQMINLSIKRLKVFVLEGKQYIGVLPDDIGKRLIKFIKSGNKYEAYIKSAGTHRVSVFIKEVHRSSRFKDQPSFIIGGDKSLKVDRNAAKKFEEKETEVSYPLEEEES